MTTPKKRRIVTRWEWILIILVILFFMTIMLPKCGVNIIDRTEQNEMLDRPHD